MLCQKTNRLNRQKVGMVFYYFDYNRKEQTALDLVKCLLKQLVSQLGPLPQDNEETKKANEEINKAYEEIKNAYYHWKNRSDRPKREDLSDLFIACMKHFSSVFIVLDAFDESLKSERLELIKELARFSKSGLRQFVTTRPHIRVFDKVKKALRAANTDVLEILATKEDVEKYLARELDQEAEDIDQNLAIAIVKTISSSVHGKYNLI
jgi:hypothetical protein